MYGILPDSIDSHTQPTSETVSGLTITFEVKCYKGKTDSYKRISDLANNVTVETQRNALDLGPLDTEYDDIDTDLDDAIDLTSILNGDASVEKYSPDVTYSNVFDLDPNVIEDADTAKSEFTDKILKHYLSSQAAMLTGNETAIAYAEATMRDHYGIDVTIEDTISPVLEDIFILAQANISVHGAGLPDHLSLTYLNRLAEVLADNTPAKMKSHKAAKSARDHIRKHKADLDHASVNPATRIGTSRGR